MAVSPLLIDAALARNSRDELLQLAFALTLDPPEETHPGEAERARLGLALHPHANGRDQADSAASDLAFFLGWPFG